MTALRLSHPTPTSFPEPVARFFAVPAPGEAPAAPARRPPLRVIPGGRDAALRHRRSVHVYRRRRVAAALAVAAMLALVALSGRGALGLVAPPSGSTPAADPAAAGPAAPLEAPVGDSYVVQPGDSLWSIAERLQPEGDVRALVDQLARRAGGATLEAGARLDLTGLRG